MRTRVRPRTVREDLMRVGNLGDADIADPPAQSQFGTTRTTPLHMSELTQCFHAAAFVLRSPAPFCDCRHAELRNDLRNG